MFLQASVILGGCLVPGRVSGLGGVCSGGGLLRGGLLRGGVPGGDPSGTATAAGGTHPTGMHSCFKISATFVMI